MKLSEVKGLKVDGVFEYLVANVEQEVTLDKEKLAELLARHSNWSFSSMAIVINENLKDLLVAKGEGQ